MQNVFKDSYLRANVVAWLPVKAEDHILYIGEKGDVISEKLGQMSDFVTCIAPQTYGGALWADVPGGNWDYIICLGELADLARAAAGDRLRGAEQIISLFAQGLSGDGKLILAVENIFGLKYFAGVKEEGSGTWFGALEGGEASSGYTKQELLGLFDGVGLSGCSCYYPYPDYRFAMALYSDDYLPKQGELIDQVGNFDRERLVLFDETKAADTVVSHDKFQEFSNSFLFAAGKTDSAIRNGHKEQITFVKFSNDRALRHNIRTYITKSEDGKHHLLKMPDSGEAAAQISNMEKTYHALHTALQNTKFCVNRYFAREEGAEFEFLRGSTMEEALDSLLEQGKSGQAREKMMEALSEIQNCGGQQEFCVTPEFEAVFGRPDLPEGLHAFSVADIDMIMPNILLREDTDDWTVIDYEWSFHFPVPVHFILYRAIHYYAETTAKRRLLDAKSLYRQAGITDQELSAYGRMEQSFQEYVLESHVPIRQLYRESGKPAYHITSLLHIKHEIEQKRMMQIYFDRGEGTREDDCINYHSKSLDGEFHLEILVEDDVTAVRIDPAGCACTAEIRRLCFDSSRENIVEFYGPVHKIGGNIYLFEAEDPYLLITALPAGRRRLLVDMRVETMSLAAAELIAPKIDTKYRIRKMLKK